jgi:hypothetical protein
MTGSAATIRPAPPRTARASVSHCGYARNAPSVLTSVFEEPVEILALEAGPAPVAELSGRDLTLACSPSNGLDGRL